MDATMTGKLLACDKCGAVRDLNVHDKIVLGGRSTTLGFDRALQEARADGWKVEERESSLPWDRKALCPTCAG